MTVKEIENIFSNEPTLTDILLSLLPENEEYSIFIHKIINDITKMEDNENEWYYV